MKPIRKVCKIENTVSLFPTVPNTPQHKRRVAAYARVSTDSDEQLSSYEAQVDFYTRHIQSNPEWEFVSVYTDEDVYFEKENIWPLDANGELLITIKSSLGQEDIRSISENTTWGQRKRFADGSFVTNKEQAEGKNNHPVITPCQSKK